MARGKQTCKILKEIRRQIAEANDIEFVTSECRYKGDCLGTCPKCEAEVRYLEQQLRKRQLAGRLVNLAGISAGAIAMLAPIAVQSRTPDTSLTKGYVATQAMADTIIVKGVAFCEYTAQDGSVVTDTLIGAIVRNINSKKQRKQISTANLKLMLAWETLSRYLILGLINRLLSLITENL